MFNMGIAAVAVAFCYSFGALSVAATPQYYGVVIKVDNPGTLSCTDYCQSPQGGPSYLTCISAWDNSTARYMDCGAVRGPGPVPVTCQCGGPPGSVKHGNLGDISCTSFCQNSSPVGPSYPSCVAALNTAADGGGTYISCDAVRGVNESYPVTCLCNTNTGNNTVIKQGTGLVSCSDFCQSRQGGGYPAATAAYDTWSQQYIDINQPRSRGGSMPLQCSCLAQPTGGARYGNDGTLSCSDYCAANTNGMHGYTACSAAYDTVAMKYIPCTQVRGGSLVMKEVVCYCYDSVQTIGATCAVPASVNGSAADFQPNASMKMSSGPAATAGSSDSLPPGYMQLVKQQAVSSGVLTVVPSVETYTVSSTQGRRLLGYSADNSTDLNRTSHQTNTVNLLQQSDPTWKTITSGAGGFVFISNVTACQPYEALASVQVTVLNTGGRMATAYSCAAVGDRFVKKQAFISYANVYNYKDMWWSLSKLNVSCMAGTGLPRSQSIPQTGFIGGFWMEPGSVFHEGYMEADAVAAKTGINITFPQPLINGGMFLRWIYACAWPADSSRYTVDNTQCVELSTTPIPRGDSIAVMANHPMVCPGDALLSAFKVNNDDHSHTTWITYTCCKATPLPRHLPRIHKLKSCDRLSYLSQLYNSPPAALLWSSPGLKPVADDIFYQTPTQDLNLYLPNSVSNFWGEKYARKVVEVINVVPGVKADPDFMATILPVVLPLDVYTADAAICLLVNAATDDLEVKTQRTYYLMGSLWSALQNETILSTIESLQNFNATFDGTMTALEIRRGQECSNLTLSDLSQPPLPDCMCNNSSAAAQLKCLADIMTPLTVQMCADHGLLNKKTTVCPLYYADGDNVTVYGKPELTAIGRFQPWDPLALPEGIWSVNNTPQSTAGRKILQDDTDITADVGETARQDAKARDFATAGVLAGAAVAEVGFALALMVPVYIFDLGLLFLGTVYLGPIAIIITIIAALVFLFMAIFGHFKLTVVIATLSTAQIQTALLAAPHKTVVLYQAQQPLMISGQLFNQTSAAATNVPAVPWSPPTDYTQPLNPCCKHEASDVSGATGYRKLLWSTPTVGPSTSPQLWSTGKREDAGRRLALVQQQRRNSAVQ